MKKVLVFLGLIILPFSMISNVKAASYASDTLKGKVVTSGDGLYVDKYTEGRYVYRGGNPNNFIKFNDELWRVISVETDGTLKIIRANHLGESMLFNTNNNNEEDGTYCDEFYKQGYGCNVWAKTDLITGNTPWGSEISGTVTKDATLNIYLNKDYYKKLNQNSKKQIVSKDYYFGFTQPENYWGFPCPKDFSEIVAEEKSQVWNGKIALANLSDIINATTDFENCGPGTVISNHEIGCSKEQGQPVICTNSCADTNWLMPSKKYKFTDYTYLLLNADKFNGYIYAISYHGFDTISGNSEEYNTNFDKNWYNTQSYVRPVTYLRSDMEITKGDGSENNPYELQCDECGGTKNNDSNESNLIVDVPPTSMFISAFIIGGFTLITIICIIIYLKVFKKKDIKK